MKILHTADWHIGKKLFQISRSDEQRAALSELEKLCDAHGVDVVVVAGDVYDTCNPSAEAEEIFYSAAVRLSRGRIFVALSGNHDDSDRLSAPGALARACNILLAGKDDLSDIQTDCVTGGPNSLVITKGGERLNLAVLPYQTEARSDGRYDSYTDRVRALLARGAQCFSDDGFNMTAAHLFTVGGETTEGDERTLGTACIVPADVIPPCDYAALGHIHKPMTVSRSRRIEYAGSLLNYHFGDTTDKSVVLIDTADRSVTRLPITAGRRLVRVYASDFNEAMTKLKAAGDCYAELVYAGEPLKPSETSALKDTACVSVRVERSTASATAVRRAMLSDRELFDEFYKTRFGGRDEAVTQLFLRFAGGEDVTA